ITGADLEDRDEYTADNVFWVPASARWAELQKKARSETIGTKLDKAMAGIEKENGSLRRSGSTGASITCLSGTTRRTCGPSIQARGPRPSIRSTPTST
ncbi:MAG TPA: hypothetical protein EYQ27_07380, partial [Gemmatimonadetes bacterium]|nr:hypothetical protein [Gemmatimonadota bacterium]